MVVGLLLVIAIQVAEASWFGVMLPAVSLAAAIQTWTFRYAATIILISRRRPGVLLHSQREDAVPRRLGRRRACTGVLWRLAFGGFSWYIASNSRLAFIQGSIAAVVVFLLWIYVSSVILMHGVEFTAAVRSSPASSARMKCRRPPRPGV